MSHYFLPSPQVGHDFQRATVTHPGASISNIAVLNEILSFCSLFLKHSPTIIWWNCIGVFYWPWWHLSDQFICDDPLFATPDDETLEDGVGGRDIDCNVRHELVHAFKTLWKTSKNEISIKHVAKANNQVNQVFQTRPQGVVKGDLTPATPFFGTSKGSVFLPIKVCVSCFWRCPGTTTPSAVRVQN